RAPAVAARLHHHLGRRAAADQGVRALFHHRRQRRGGTGDRGLSAPFAGTALSGPAGGVAAAVALAREGVARDLITFDMGGTSTDIALVQDGQANLSDGRAVANARIGLPALGIGTLGAGGG